MDDPSASFMLIDTSWWFHTYVNSLFVREGVEKVCAVMYWNMNNKTNNFHGASFLLNTSQFCASCDGFMDY